MPRPRPQPPLERELAKYNQLLPSLADREGQYIVIVGDQVVGYFEDYSDALAAGYQRVGSPSTPFLVKQIHQNEPPIHIRGMAV